MSKTTGEQQAPHKTSPAFGVPQRQSRASLRATGRLTSWRTVDILTVAFLGAALGIAFWGWGVFYNGPITALKIGYAPLFA